MNLFNMNAEIANAMLDIMASVDEETGEVDAEVVARLDALQAARDTKLENLGLWIKQLEAEAQAIRSEETALAARRKAKEKMVERLKNYITSALQADEQTRFETPLVLFTFRRSEKVEVEADKLPEQYFRQNVETSPDLTAIKTAIKNGQRVAGAQLVIKQNLQIK